MAEVGPEYQFLHAEVGMNGKNSDGGACEQRPLRKALENNTLNLPKPTPQSGDLDDIPFVCVGDDAFLLSTYMMKPYPQKDLSRDKRIFNRFYRLPRARRISENAFGILASRWRVFRKPFLFKPEKVKVLAYSILILHTFLKGESTTGCGTGISGDWRKDEPSGT